MPAGIRIEGVEHLLAKLKSLEELKPVTGALLAGGAHVAGKFKEYPGQTRLTREAVYGTPFKSEKQRRYFFAALARGEIEVPYRRGSSPGSRNMKQGWTVQALTPLSVEIGNNAPYAQIVHGAGRQSRFMAALGWRTDKQIVDAERATVAGYVQAVIRREIEK